MLSLSLARSVLPCATLLALAGCQTHEDPQLAAGELFRSSCLACHVPPDSRFEVDRAWLGQVSDTA